MWHQPPKVNDRGVVAGQKAENMKESNREQEDWRPIAERASREQDPEKLMELISELDLLLMQSKSNKTENSAVTPCRSETARGGSAFNLKEKK